MTTTEERLQILRMVGDGQISAEDGAKLLAALDRSEGESAPGATGRARWFRVRVTDMHTGKNKVNVNIPLGLVNVGMRMGAKFAPEVANTDLQEIMQAIKEGVVGKIIDVENNEDGERVEVYVE